MGVGALLNGHIVWLILRGGEVQGLHPQGLAADGLGWVYVDSCFFFFFFPFFTAAFMTSSFRLWLTSQKLLSSALCQSLKASQLLTRGLADTIPASSRRNESRAERWLAAGFGRPSSWPA